MARYGPFFAAALAALTLGACTARDIPYPTLEAKYANAQSRFMDLPGGLHVHYRDQGPRDAQTLVLVHGFSASLHAWEPWVARLARDHRVITLDVPGHGLTRAPAGYVTSLDRNVAVVDELTRRLGAPRFVLGGNSMGGGIAWTYALAHPDRVEGLVLVDPAGWPSREGRQGAPIVFKLLGNPLGRAYLRQADPRPMAQSGLRQAYYDARLVTPDLVDRYVDLARAPGHREMLTTPRPAPAAPVTAATFARIHAPTLILWGEQDALIPVADGRAMAAAIPGAQLITYPGVGHVPMEQIPERTAEDVRRFLAGLP